MIFKKCLTVLFVLGMIISVIPFMTEVNGYTTDFSTSDDWTITGSAFYISSGTLHGENIKRNVAGEAQYIFDDYSENFTTEFEVSASGGFPYHSIFEVGIKDNTNLNKTSFTIAHPDYGTSARVYKDIVNTGTNQGSTYQTYTDIAGIYIYNLTRSYVAVNNTFLTVITLTSPTPTVIASQSVYTAKASLSEYNCFYIKNGYVEGDTSGGYSISITDFTITYDTEGEGSSDSIEFLTYPLLSAIIGEPYYYDANVSYSSATWELETNCSDLEINSSSGLVTGTPSAKGYYYVNITVSNLTDSNYQNYTLITNYNFVTADDGKTWALSLYFSTTVQFGEHIFTTYTAQGSTNGEIAIVHYNGTNWSSPEIVGSNPIDIAHGGSSVAVTNDGYIHVFYGAHNSQLYYKRSAKPLDITSWDTMSTPVVDDVTYPSPWVNPDNGRMYLFYRGEVTETNKDHYYIYSDNSGTTWSSRQIWLDSNVGDVAYGAYEGMYPVEVNDVWYIHISWCYHYYSTQTRNNLFHAYMNVATGNWYNMKGTNLGVTITEAEANSNCMVVNSGVGGKDVWFPNTFVDNSTNIPYITYSYNDNGWSIKYIYWNGYNWISPITVTDRINQWNYGVLIINANDEQLIYAPSDDSSLIEEYILDGSTWRLNGYILKLSQLDGSATSLGYVIKIANSSFAGITIRTNEFVSSATGVPMLNYGSTDANGNPMGYIENGTTILTHETEPEPEPEPEPIEPSYYLKTGKMLIILACGIPFIGFIVWAFGKKD